MHFTSKTSSNGVIQRDQQWDKAIHRARAAGEPSAPIVIDYSMSLAERAVPEWHPGRPAGATRDRRPSSGRLRRRDVGCRDRADVNGSRIPNRCSEFRRGFRVQGSDRGGKKDHHSALDAATATQNAITARWIIHS